MKRIQITLLLLLIPLALGAVNWEIRGVTVTRRSVDSTTGIIRLHLKDPKGRPFEISLPGTINEKQSNEILRLNDVFYSWEKIHVKKIEYYLSDTIIHIIVHPEKIMVDGKDIKEKFPAGIALFKSPERFTYHFRILDGDKSIPVEGSYTDEDSLLGYTNTMVQGVRNGNIRFSESGYTVHQNAGGVPVSVWDNSAWGRPNDEAVESTDGQRRRPGRGSLFGQCGMGRAREKGRVSVERKAARLPRPRHRGEARDR